MEKRNISGYPHIDKPWMQFHDEELANKEDMHANLTEYLKSKTKGLDDNIATVYYGNKTNYGEFWQKVNNASKAMSVLGIDANDRVMNLVPNIPESGEIFLGAAQIGAISDFIDPRPDSMDLIANAKKVLELIDFEKTNHIIALDQCYLGMLKPIENELKERGIDRIVTLSAADSMTPFGKLDYLKDVITYNNLKNNREKYELEKEIEKMYKNGELTKEEEQELRRELDSRLLKWYRALSEKVKLMKKMDEKYNEAVKSSSIEIIKYADLLKSINYANYRSVYNPNQIIYIAHTSGTSGARPKPITLTSENLISGTEQLGKIGRFYSPNEKILHILPYFSPLGGNNNYILNLASGATNIEIPEFEINEIGYLIKKYRPNVFLATPSWLLSLMHCKYLQKMDLSFINRIVYGGDSMTKEDEEKLNAWLKAHGCKVSVEKGHGMSEYGGCGSYSYKDYNRYDSIGVPLPNTTYTLVNPDVDDRLEPLKFTDDKERLLGEIAVTSDAVTPGVLDDHIIVPKYKMADVEVTDKAILDKLDKRYFSFEMTERGTYIIRDNRDYMRTRDIAEMDRDGLFYFHSRKDRSFSRFDGYKVKPYEIEKVIEESPLVKYCRIVPYYDEAMRGIMPKAHIVLDDSVDQSDIKEITKEIIEEQILKNPQMSSRQIPRKVKYRDSLPMTKNSKTNFNALINEGLDGTEISVNVEETNISVGKIDIILPRQDKKKVLK